MDKVVTIADFDAAEGDVPIVQPNLYPKGMLTEQVGDDVKVIMVSYINDALEIEGSHGDSYFEVALFLDTAVEALTPGWWQHGSWS